MVDLDLSLLRSLDFIRYMLGEPKSMDVKATEFPSGMVNLSMILHILNILRQSGVWDIDLKYKKKERTLPVNGGVLFYILGKCFPNI